MRKFIAHWGEVFSLLSSLDMMQMTAAVIVASIGFCIMPFSVFNGIGWLVFSWLLFVWPLYTSHSLVSMFERFREAVKE